jgi:signal transduction histidine kinase
MDLQAHSAGVRRLVHEFNNLLLVIGGHCELLSEQCADSPQAKADLATVADAVSRATELTAELRAMAIAIAAEPAATAAAHRHDVVRG